MSEKITLQAVADSLSKACGIPKKTAELLSRSFFDVITESLSSEDSVRIEGLGVFKVVEVASRESINVTNGERIVIPGYKKVNFTPEEGLVLDGMLDEADDDSQSDAVVASDNENDGGQNDNNNIVMNGIEKAVDEINRTLEEVKTPERVEVPEDEFSTIDMLICTPESVAEIKLELEEARAKAAEKLKEAVDARREVLRLEALLEKMRNGVQPESVDDENDVEDVSGADDADGADAEETDAQEPVAVVNVPVEEPVLNSAAESVCAEKDDKIVVELPETNDLEHADAAATTDVTATASAEDNMADENADGVSGILTADDTVSTDETTESGDAVVTDEDKCDQPVEDSSDVDDMKDGDNEPDADVSETSEDVTENKDALAAVSDADSQTAEADSAESEKNEAVDIASVDNNGDNIQNEATEVQNTSEGDGDAAKESSEEETSEGKDAALNRFLSDTPKVKEIKEEKDYLYLYVLVPFAVVLLCCCAAFWYLHSTEKAERELRELPVKPKSSVEQEKKNVVNKPTEQVNASETSEMEQAKKDEKTTAGQQVTEKASKPVASTQKQKTYVLKKGESLTKVSQAFYNTKDSVSAIIRVNKFKDPNNVPYGTEIILP